MFGIFLCIPHSIFESINSNHMKKLLPLNIVLLFFNYVLSAQFSIPLQKTAGGDNTDNMNAMIRTNDNGFIVIGYSSSGLSGDKTDTSRGGQDIWVIKYNIKGVIEWQKTIGGNDHDVGSSIQQTKDGGYIVGGYSFSNKSGEKTADSRGDLDYWLIKLNAKGVIEWDKTIGGNLKDWLRVVRQTADGGYILAGYSYSDISGDKTAANLGYIDYWLVKTDSLGNKQWDKTYGGSDVEELTCFELTKDGGYIFGGYTLSYTKGDYDYYIVKTDSNGVKKWSKNYGGTGLDNLRSVRQTRDGGYVLGGWSSSPVSGDKTSAGNGKDDYWLVKINANGKVMWDRTIGGSSFDNLMDMQVTADGGYILAGGSVSDASGDKTESMRGGLFRDFWVVKLDSSRNIQWDKTIGGYYSDDVRSISVINTDNYLIGGISLSGKGAEKKSDARGLGDFWIVLLHSNAGKSIVTDINDISSTMLSATPFAVYPNPARDNIKITVANSSVISVVNSSGKIILKKKIDRSGLINVSNLPTGIYFIQNNTTGEMQRINVIK